MLIVNINYTIDLENYLDRWDVMSGMDMFMTIIAIFGGLGVFLYGINLMGDSLKAIAGDRLKVFIEKTTNTPIKGILVGTLVTALIQSSSGTTALTVGLVRAGLMTFPQAVGIIMGANVGTTITSFIVGLNIEKYSLIFVGIGAILIFFIKQEKIRQLGSIILGFGLLFYGLGLMGDSLKSILKAYEEPTSKLFTFLASNPILGLFIGTAITAVVQSSSATISILQTLYGQGAIALIGAIPILLGCNIGTTITACFACVGGGTEAKRTAFVHALFNVIGALLFMILLIPYSKLVLLIQDNLLSGLFGPNGEPPKMTLAIAHMIFNLATTFILFFFIKQMVWVATKVIKDKEIPEDKIIDELLDYSLIEKSSILALSFVKRAVDYMASKVRTYVHITKGYAFVRDDSILAKGEALERDINVLDKRIHDYLIKLTIVDLSKDSSKFLSKYLDQIKDLERVGDHCTNLLEFFKERYEKNMHLSDDGTQDLEQIFDVLMQMTDKTTEAIEKWSSQEAVEASKFEDQIDKLQDVLHERHVHRVNNGLCSFINTERYVEILSNIERMGDHLENICQSITTDEYCKYDEFDH